MMHKTAKVKIMKKIYYVPALLAGMLSLASCNDNEPNGGNAPSGTQYGINFSLSQDSPSSRTHYAENDWLQIAWNMDDKITIVSNQTQSPLTITDPETKGYESPSNWKKNTSAVYKVTKVITEPHEVGTTSGKKWIANNSGANIEIGSGKATDALYWTTGEHIFYAGYGEDITIDASTGVAKCKYQTEQILEPDDSTGTWINMNQAYMVAYLATEPIDVVKLKFRPIMTTVEVDVKGPESGEITVKAMEIVIPESQDKIYGDENKECTYFDYTITETGGSAKADPNTPTAEKILFRLKTPQTIGPNDVIKITALLPPVEISNANPATISIYANEGSSSTIFTPAKDKPINVSAKAVIKTDAWKQSSLPQNEVDLGLSVKWAEYNLGATHEYELGDYYGWGCTIPYASSEYVNSTLYFHRLGLTDKTIYISICGTERDPLKDYVNNKKSIAGTEWDAATYSLGGKWRIPTQEEMKELHFDCDWVWTDNYKDRNGIPTGVAGYVVTSKNSSKTSIFLPAAGYSQAGYLPEPNGWGYYWSATPNDASPQRAYDLDFWKNAIDNAGKYSTRYYGYTIRPVWDESMDAGIDRQGSSGSSEAGDWE